jgi:hypothetical protein
MTDFDEFLRTRNELQSAQGSDTTLLAAEAMNEWHRLKDRAREITDGKALGSEKFEWAPYPAPYPDFLKLKDVAATFISPRIAGDSQRDFRITFARRPLRANEMWVDDDPIPPKPWLLTLEVSSGLFYWSLKNNVAKRTTEEFAIHIAQELVEYYEAYTAALKSQYPWLSF